MDPLEVAVDRRSGRDVGEAGVTAMVALDERDHRSDEGCEEEDVHGRNYAPMDNAPRVAELPMFIEFLP